MRSKVGLAGAGVRGSWDLLRIYLISGPSPQRSRLPVLCVCEWMRFINEVSEA